MLFCHLLTIVSQHQSRSQNNLMVFEFFYSLLRTWCYNKAKVGEIQLKIGQFAGKYRILVIVPRQIYRYILNKLQLMSVTKFRCVSARYYRFEGKEKMVTHLIIRI